MYHVDMAKLPRQRRIAFTGSNNAEYMFRGILGVFDYIEQTKHWKLLGGQDGPFVPFDEIDLSAVDGVIGYFHEPAWIDAICRAGVAAVNASNRYDRPELPRVSNDDKAIGRMAADHLIERGFAEFSFVGSFDDWFTQLRFEGFSEQLDRSAGRSSRMFDGRGHRPGVQQAIEQMLDQSPRPVGVMASNDALGRMVVEHALNRGLRVPEDVAVIGVDNNRWLTQLSSVPLTSVETDANGIGYAAAKALDQLMEGQAVPTTQWIPPTQVIARRSTDVILAKDPIVTHALAFIREHCTQELTVEAVLEELGVSRRKLELRMKRAVGQTPHAAITQARVELAKQLLIYSDQTLDRIAQKCGIKPEQFYAIFKRLTGMPPGTYRQRMASRRSS